MRPNPAELTSNQPQHDDGTYRRQGRQAPGRGPASTVPTITAPVLPLWEALTRAPATPPLWRQAAGRPTSR